MVVSTELYDLLGITPTANETEIKKAYRRLALRYHPDKPTRDAEKFKQISEAFTILSSPDKRKIYDMHGLDAARGNPSMESEGFFGGRGAGGGPTSTTFSTNRTFTSDDAFNIFSQMGGFGMADDFGFGSVFSGSKCFENFHDSFDLSSGRQSRKVEPDVVTISMPVSLIDLFTGCVKKMKLNRKGPNGSRESKIVEVTIKPGWKAGTKITFKNEGDYQLKCQARQNIQFVLEEKPHPIFKREGNNLRIDVPLTFKESLCGFQKDIITIDNRKLNINRVQPVTPGFITTYSGLGMPLPKNPSNRGDLEVCFKVSYPTSLTPAQRQIINQNF